MERTEEPTYNVNAIRTDYLAKKANGNYRYTYREVCKRNKIGTGVLYRTVADIKRVTKRSNSPSLGQPLGTTIEVTNNSHNGVHRALQMLLEADPTIQRIDIGSLGDIRITRESVETFKMSQ